ncbi:MAG: hypothetical protein AB7D37_06085 [Desulfovibrio sp.]
MAPSSKTFRGTRRNRPGRLAASRSLSAANPPDEGQTWTPLSFWCLDLIQTLRTAGYGELFIQEAVLEFIKANPFKDNQVASEVFVLSEHQNKAVQRASVSTKHGYHGDA